MADPHIQITINTQDQEQEQPLLPPTQNKITHQDINDLNQSLNSLETFLSFLGFHQSSILSFILSWSFFILIGGLLPVLILEWSNCSGCNKYQIKDFEVVIIASQACLAAVSLGCISLNLKKYGIRTFLFVDRCSNHSLARFSKQYIQQIKDSLRLLVLWSLPCFVLKVVREVIRISYVKHESWWLSTAILFGLILSWSYVSTISLTASILFHLVCNIQVIHFNDYAKLLERESDVLVFIEEHIRLRYHLSRISHRFRIFLLLQFCVVTTSQIVTLFQTTGYSGIITVINGGDFAVSSIVQVVGIILCLHAATKISHRAQGIASVASRWHALATCGSNDSSHLRVPNGVGHSEVANPQNSLHLTFSESDLESVDYIAMPTTTQLASYMTSYHKSYVFAKQSGRNHHIRLDG